MTTLHASALSAPPPPALPILTQPLAPDDLAGALRALNGSYYANHPFHSLMHEGRLTQRQLQGWVANRLAYQRAIPRKDAAILSNCPDPDVRREWLLRIIDHDGTEAGTGGIEKWIKLGEALGVPREEMEDERHVLPGVRFAAEAYVTFCKTKPWIDSVASSLTELFAGPDAAAHRRLPAALPVGPSRSARLLQEPADAGPAGQSARPATRDDPLHDRRDAAPGLRGAGLQARDAVGDD